MPKIPTFTSQARPTAEVAGVKSNLQIDPTKTPAAGLSALAGVAQEYYIKQRDNVETLEANKKFYEMKSEGSKIADRLKNNPNEFEVADIYNNEFGAYKNGVLQGIQNRRVRKKIENLISIDQPETIYKLKQNAFKQYEIQENETYGTQQNIYSNDYSLELDGKKKSQIKNQRIESAIKFEARLLKGKEWLSKELKKIETDSVIFDADKALSNNNPDLALEIIKRADKSKVNSKELKNKILEIEKERAELNENNYYASNLIKGNNLLIGAKFTSTTEKKVIQHTERILFSSAQKQQKNPEETFAFVDKTMARNGIVSTTYKDLLDAGYNAGSTTTFDSLSDIPKPLIQAVKVAETADKNKRLNVYTNPEQERFYKNVIVLKKVKGFDDYQAIKQAKEFEQNYDANIIKGSNKQRGKTLKEVEGKFKDSKSTNVNEVRGYAGQLYDMYTMLGIDDDKARKQVVKDIEKNIIEIDNHSYLKRNIVAFQAIDGVDNIPVYKKYIIKNNMEQEEDPDDYYLRHNGGGQFEIRRRADLSPVYSKDNKPMIFYAKDLNKMKSEQTEQFKKDIIEQQRKTQEQRLFVSEQETYMP
jgi:hypothetical protein